jgi:hypothetical protein
MPEAKQIVNYDWLRQACDITGTDYEALWYAISFAQVNQHWITNVPNQPVKPAHISDFIRLNALATMGGWWLDLDVIVRKQPPPIDQTRLHIGQERFPDGKTVGLCNAIMCAPTHSMPFVVRWLSETKKHFSPAEWNAHSVGLPWELAKQGRDYVHVWDTEECLWPTWDAISGLAIFVDRCDDVSHKTFALHLWESNNMAHMQAVTPQYLQQSQSLFAKIARNDD